jgi:transcription elongation factor Elf1
MSDKQRVYIINTEDSCPECGHPGYSRTYDETTDETTFTCEECGRQWDAPGKVDRADEATAEYIDAFFSEDDDDDQGYCGPTYNGGCW